MKTKMLTKIDNIQMYNDMINLEKDLLQKFEENKTYQEFANENPTHVINPLVNEPHPSTWECTSRIINLFYLYNIFNEDYITLNELENEIINLFKETYPERAGEKFYLSGWLVTLREGDVLGDHFHMLKDGESWYGYYCVNTTGSATIFESGDVDAVNGMLTLFQTDGQVHSVSTWNNPDSVRITIGYHIFKTPIADYAKEFTV